MEATPRCFTCSGEAPKTHTDYTLIGCGWRLVRRPTPDGSFSFEWRCPTCWAKYKAQTGHSSSASLRGKTGGPATQLLLCIDNSGPTTGVLGACSIISP
ncbi:MAG: hypothetical protein ACRENE_16760 [Polyangiaceae bacterium]